MSKPIIRLHDHVGTGIIIEYPTGVIYSNQAGGGVCLQPELEGALMPIANDVLIDGDKFLSPETELLRYFRGPKHSGTGAVSGLDDADADFIDAVMDETSIDVKVKVDRTRLKESVEAWVWISVGLGDQGVLTGITQGFAPGTHRGILTWSNSD